MEPGAGGPPPGMGPLPAGGPPPGGGEGNVWHMPFADYVHFVSPTRAMHYEYFLSIYPQPEVKGVTAPGATALNRTRENALNDFAKKASDESSAALIGAM